MFLLVSYGPVGNLIFDSNMKRKILRKKNILLINDEYDAYSFSFTFFIVSYISKINQV